MTTPLKLMEGGPEGQPELVSMYSHRPYPRIVCKCGKQWVLQVDDVRTPVPESADEHADQFRHICIYVPPGVTPEDAMR